MIATHETEALAVMFRVDREGSVFAIFPECEERPGEVGTWEINGGSSSGPRIELVAGSRPAKPREYRELLRVLRRHHKVRIVKRAPRRMR
jgi:hypothetical protein